MSHSWQEYSPLSPQSWMLLDPRLQICTSKWSPPLQFHITRTLLLSPDPDSLISRIQVHSSIYFQVPADQIGGRRGRDFWIQSPSRCSELPELTMLHLRCRKTAGTRNQWQEMRECLFCNGTSRDSARLRPSGASTHMHGGGGSSHI